MTDSVFANSRLMITGGTGSFGNAVINRFLRTDIKELVVFSRDEKKQFDMREQYKNPRLKFVLGDVRDTASVRAAMEGIDYVFHAAALKQVPSCEFYPSQAVKTNILGTENAINAAVDARVKKFVLLSTDKAVYPINAMGMSKALAEKLLVAKARNIDAKDTTLSATRYGNVMASRGSIIPIFVEKIKAGEKITITDPNMTRFLMSLEDSVDLVMHAFNSSDGGSIYVQKAPACTVKTMSEALKELFSSSVEDVIIGARHGEKMHETLVSNEEMAKAVDQGKFFNVMADNRDLNYSSFITKGQIERNSMDDYNSSNTQILGVSEVISLLKTLDYIKFELGEIGSYSPIES